MKNLSLRKKLFIQIGGLSITLVLLLFGANTFFLEPYYLNQTKQQLISQYDELLDLNLDEENLDIISLISIQDKSNIEIVITDPQRHLIYSSIGYMNNENNTLPNPNGPEESEETDDIIGPNNVNAPPHRKIPELNIIEQSDISESTRFLTGKDPISSTKLLIFEGDYSEEYRVELRVTLLSITKATELFNKFILITGIILFILALILANIISKHFTEPIKNITYATTQIKELDFETYVHVDSTDELGTLSDNINQMNSTLKEVFEDLSIANSELQNEIHEKTKLDNKRKELLNSVSHELKTPLSILQGYAEALTMGVITDKDKQDFYCNVIIDEANKTNKLLSHLLDINQLEFGDIKLHKSKVAFDEFMSYLVEKLSTHNKSPLSIDSLNPINVTIYADPLRLEQVITNYIQNAIKYVDEHKNIGIRWTTDTEHLRIYIYNSHEHFSPKTMEQLFDSFYKGDSSRDRSKGGYGLGLSIVKAIQEADHNKYGANNVTDGVEFYADFDLYQVSKKRCNLS